MAGFAVTFAAAVTTMGIPMREADAELVARSRRHDAEAFGALVERHQRLVFGVALARCQDPALAEDVAQEAFVAAWRDLDRLRDGERVGSWVAGIARNLAANAARQRARRAETPPPADELAAVPTPQDEALAREDRELLQRALADMPEAHRETLVLYYMEGQSISAIADALGIREDLVKQRLSRGRKALRDAVTARVETALTRVRTSPTFRAGVITAIAATGAREAKAATAGKMLTMFAAKKVVIAGAAVVLAGGAIWLGTRADADHAKPVAGKAAPPSAAREAGEKHMVHRLANPAVERPPLVEAIRRAQQLRRAAAAAPALSASSSGTPPPSLPRDDNGDIDKQYIRAAVKELIPMLQGCYETGLLSNAKLAGKVLIEFTIEGEPDVGGVVGDSKVDPAETTLNDASVLECLQETMYALEIEPPASGGRVVVRYPFEFSTH